MSTLRGVVQFGGKVKTKGGVEVQTHPDQGLRLGEKVWVLMDETTGLITEVVRRDDESPLDDGPEWIEEKPKEEPQVDESGFVINPAEYGQ